MLPLSLIVSDATIGSMWAIGALILTILGLSGVLPAYMLGVSCIVVGATFLMLASIGITWALMFRFAEHSEAWDRFLLRTGVTAVFAAGFAGIALGVLNLIFPTVLSLTAIAIIAMGAGLMWHSAVMSSVSRFTRQSVEQRRPRGFFGIMTLSLAPVRNFVVGAGGVVLGILALVGLVPVVFTLVGLLALAAGLIFTLSTLCSATLTTLRCMHC